MATRLLNRRELRKQAEQEGPPNGVEANKETVTAPPKKGAKAKTKVPAAPKARKPRKKKEPVRLRARWGVFDAGMKQVAIFDYNQRGAADEKLADLRAKRKGLFFLQIVKDPMPVPELPAAVGA